MTLSARFRDIRLSIANVLGKAWESPWGVPLLASLLSAALFAITLQTDINGSSHAYATDVGELQNALPRWGTIHFSGYPLYSITGSLIVTLLRLVGIQPAMGSSLVSLLWGAMTAAVVVLVARELGAERMPALLGAIAFSVSTSMWIDSSLAEVHSLTMLFIMAILFFAIRYDRTGERRDLIWLTVALSQGVFHGRSVVGVVPAIFLILLPRWRQILRHLPLLMGISLLAPLLYLYLPLREWMGSDWTFGNTSTWEGFWRMLLNIKAARFASVSREAIAWPERLQATLQTLDGDLPLLLLVAGTAGLFALNRPKPAYWRYALALLLAWLPYFVVPLIVYAGFVGDATLAIKLPIPMFAGVGLALLVTRFHKWQRYAGCAAAALVLAGIGFSAWRNYPNVVAITQDRGVEHNIAIADQAANPDEPTVLMMLWGHSFWGAAYAQEYRGQLEGVVLVDHNAPFQQILADGYHLVTLSETFYQRPASWWADLLGPVYLDTYAPGLIEIRTTPREASDAADLFRVNDDLAIASAEAHETDAGDILVTVLWQALAAPQRDYSIAVHLVAADPPGGPEDILAQADTAHPVEGWYPTTQWIEGQVVRDVYRLTPPAGSHPVAVRVTAYTVNDAGEFVNGEWLSVPVQPAP
jgi:hypothetical protein